MHTFALITFGCRVNQYDSRAVAEALFDLGWREVPPPQAEAIVINACGVTAKGSRKVRRRVYSLARTVRGKIYIMGCVPPEDRSSLLAVPQVAALVPATERERIVQIITGAKTPETLPSVRSAGSRTRGILKVQDGCNRRCTYCIVPSLRGPSRWRPVEAIAREAAHLLERGVPELWLVGTNLPSWGEGRLHELLFALDRVFRGRSGRLRLGTVSAEALSPELCNALVELPWLCPYLHLSLQSGSDRIRARMGRRLNCAEILRRVQVFRESVPRLTFGADVMVGFPGESEEDFERTRELCRRIGFVKLHVFPFSPRPGTPAASFRPCVSEHVVQQRVRGLLELEEETWRSCALAMVGETLDLVVEKEGEEAEGLTENYLRVRCCGQSLSKGTLVRVRITGLSERNGDRGRFLWGEPIGGQAGNERSRGSAAVG